ncbi:MAG: phenylacetate--CoA ligase family protein [Ignavibacteriales bacterium]
MADKDCAAEVRDVLNLGDLPEQVANIFDSYFIEVQCDQRLNKLRETICKALNSDYYRNKLYGLSVEEINQADFDLLDRIPWTTKNDLRSAGLSILTVPLEHTIRYYESSGTTGMPTPTPKTKNDIVDNSRGLLLNWQRYLTARKDIVMLMLPSDIAPVADAMVYALEAMDILTIRAFPFAGNVCGWDQVSRIVQSLRVNVLFSTPGLILYFYRELKKRGIEPSEQGIHKILLVGELVTEPMRKMLERAWRAEVYINSYGSSELGTCSTSCPEKRLHLLDHKYHFEIRNPETQEKTEKLDGELVVTTLTADARPLLRYCTGDYVKLNTSLCPCGLPSPTLDVFGRIGETIRINDRNINQYEIESVVYGIEGVTGYCVYGSNGNFSLEIEVDPDMNSETQMGKVLSNAKAKLPEYMSQLMISVTNQMAESSKRGGGLKNWKLSHVIHQ